METKWRSTAHQTKGMRVVVVMTTPGSTSRWVQLVYEIVPGRDSGTNLNLKLRATRTWQKRAIW